MNFIKFKKIFFVGALVVFIGAQCWGAAYGKDSRYRKLREAVRQGNTISALELISTGMPLDAAFFLYSAAANGRAAIVDALLAKRVSVDVTRTSEDMSALHYAAQNGHATTVKLLLAGAASVDGVYRIGNMYGNGGTALHFAAQNGHVAAAKALLDAGADIDGASEYGRTALYFAAAPNPIFNDDPKAAKLLLDHGASIGMVDTKGFTALHRAASRGRTAIVELLLNKNAFINARDNNGNTAIQHAIHNGLTGAMRQLLANGAYIDGADIRKVYSSFEPDVRRQIEKMVGLMINARYDALIKRCPEIKNMENSDVANQVLCALPNEIWAIVAGHLPSRNLACFRLVSKECRMLAHPILISRAAQLKENMIQFITLLLRCAMDFYASEAQKGMEKIYRTEKKIVMDLLEEELGNATSMSINELLRGAVVCNGNSRCDLAEYTSRYFKDAQ